MSPSGPGDDAPTEPLPEAEAGGSPRSPAEPRPRPSPLARAAVVAGAVLVLVAVALLGVNAWMTRSAEEAAAEHASEALGARASVRLRGWPVGLRLAAGSPVDAVVQATDVPITESAAVVSRLVIELDDVVIDRQALTDGTGGLEAARGRFVAELGPDAVEEAAGLIGQLPLVGVELRRGVARLSVAGFPVLDATAEVVDGAVVFTPTAPLGSFARVELELGALPFGFRAHDVEIRRDALRLEGSATAIRLDAP